MITNDNSWSLGATPNKSLDQFGALICSHSQSDSIGAAQPAPFFLQAFCIGQIHLPGDPIAKHRRKNCVHLTRFLTALPSVVSCGFIASIRSIQSIQIRVHSCPFVVSLPPQPLDLTLFNAF